MTIAVSVIFQLTCIAATCISLCTSANITVSPQDGTAYDTAVCVFNCTGEGDTLKRTYYKGKYVNEETPLRQQISIVHHNVSDDMVSSSLHVYTVNSTPEIITTTTTESDAVPVKWTISKDC